MQHALGDITVNHSLQLINDARHAGFLLRGGEVNTTRGVLPHVVALINPTTIKLTDRDYAS
jgi:hypothetical protein